MCAINDHPLYLQLTQCLQTVRRITNFQPEIGVVLGSGLGGFAQSMEIETAVSYADLPNFPVSTVDGHQGRFLFGYVQGIPVVAMQGRVHYYEGYDVQQTAMPIRLIGLLGAKSLLLTNAAGGINTQFRPGDMMVITDQIGVFVPSPLRGPNIEPLGPRFPDMSQIYDRSLRQTILQQGDKLGISLRQGVYVQFPGPAFETPQEIKMARILGADAVGMSTACEAIAARHMGMRVAGISLITNMAAGILDQPLSHTEVNETAAQAEPVFCRLLSHALTACARQSM